MNKRFAGIFALLFALLFALVGGVTPAQAHSAGEHWTGTYDCGSTMSQQGHWLDSVNGQTKADGFSVYRSTGGKITSVTVKEYANGVQKGSRVITYNGTSNFASLTGIQDSYLPWMQAGSEQMRVIAVYTDGKSCNVLWNIN